MPDRDFIGAIVDERYRILSLVGEGGLGTVYRATEEALGREVALKVLHFAQVNDGDSRARFEREGRILSSLSHRNIVLVYRFGFWNEQVPYLAMEYLEGKSLRQVLDEGGAMAAKRCLPIALETCDALEAAHALSIVHRDVKPSNIILLAKPEPDFVKVVDFGLAKLAGEAGTQDQRLTQTGVLLGTPQYLSPEQCLGRAADNRSDIYALACVVYEAIAGRPVFEAENPIGLLHKHATEEPVPLSVVLGEKLVPEGLDAVLLKALAKKPEERYQSMTELKEALNLVNSGRGSEIDMTNVRRIVLNLSRHKKNKKKYALVAVAGTCVLSVVFWLIRGWQQEQSAQQETFVYKSPRVADGYSHCRNEVIRADDLSKQAQLLAQQGDLPGAVAAANRTLVMLAGLKEIRGMNLREQDIELEILHRIGPVFKKSGATSFGVSPNNTRILTARFGKTYAIGLRIEYEKIRLSMHENAGKHQLAAEVCCDLSDAYCDWGQLAAAEAYLSKAQSFIKMINGDQAPMQVRYLLSKTQWLIDKGRPAEALAVLHAALPKAESMIATHLGVAEDSLYQMGVLFFFLGDEQSAERAYKQVEDLLKNADRDRNVNPLAVATSRADLLAFQGKYKEAEMLLKQRIDEVSAGDYGIIHFSVGVMQGLACLLAQQEKYDEAIRLYKKTLDMVNPISWVQRMHLLNSYIGMAYCYSKQAKYALAEAALKNSVEECRKLNHELPIPLLRSLEALAQLAMERNKLAEARGYLTQLEAILLAEESSPAKGAIWLTNERDRYVSMQANLLFHEGQYSDAQKLYKLVLARQSTRTMSYCQEKVMLLDDFAKTLMAIGNRAEAKSITLEQLSLARRYCGVLHPLTKSAKARLKELDRGSGTEFVTHPTHSGD